MKNAKWEGIRTTARIIALAIVGFVLDAVITKVTGTEIKVEVFGLSLSLQHIILGALVYLDKYIHVAQKRYSARQEQPLWTSLQIPF